MDAKAMAEAMEHRRLAENAVSRAKGLDDASLVDSVAAALDAAAAWALATCSVDGLVYRAALHDLFNANLNEMTVRGLPHEWTPDSPMGKAAKLLGEGRWETK